MATLQDQTHDQMMAELIKLRAENAKLKTTKRQGISVKVKGLGQGHNQDGSPWKGNISVYGLGRYPVTLYAKQWQELAKAMAEVLAEIEANRDVLSWKDED